MPRQRGLAVLMLDVDNFSRINDTQGHAVGDVLLKEVAHRLQACLRDCQHALNQVDDPIEKKDSKRLGRAHRRRRIRTVAPRDSHGRGRTDRGAARANGIGAAVRLCPAGHTAVGTMGISLFPGDAVSPKL